MLSTDGGWEAVWVKTEQEEVFGFSHSISVTWDTPVIFTQLKICFCQTGTASAHWWRQRSKDSQSGWNVSEQIDEDQFCECHVTAAPQLWTFTVEHILKWC